MDVSAIKLWVHLHQYCIYTSIAFTPVLHLHQYCIYTSIAFTPVISDIENWHFDF